MAAATSFLRVGMKRFFFDRDLVMRAENRATISALSKIGAFVRTAARRSMKKARRQKLSEMPADKRTALQLERRQARREGRKAPAPPLVGSKPGEPPRWWTKLLRDRVFFAYEPVRRVVVVGPEKVASKRGDVPHVLEYGGLSRGPNGKQVTIEPRPYMRPALAKVQPQMARIWAQAFRAKSRG